MAAKIISGNEISCQIRDELKIRAEALAKRGVTPGLGVVLVGDDPASASYVSAKAKAAVELGLFEETVRLPAETSEKDILAAVDRLNRDDRFNGILVQLPLPKHVSPDKVINFISPEKDVDGFHPVNVGRLLRGEPCPLPCTPYGVLAMLERTGYDPAGKHVVICGRSNIVGKPLMALLVQKKKGANATVTVCHTGTPDMSRFTLQADILVAAMGSPRAVKADMIREGCVVIDVGVNRVDDPSAPRGYRLVGDCDFEPMKEKAAAITPVATAPGTASFPLRFASRLSTAALTSSMPKNPPGMR